MGYLSIPSCCSSDQKEFYWSIDLKFRYLTYFRKRSGVIGPRKFVAKLRKENGTFPSSSQMISELFRGFMHQDAHEFLNYLLNEVAEYLVKKRKQDELKDATFIHKIFEGTLTNETKCLTCETVCKSTKVMLKGDVTWRVFYRSQFGCGAKSFRSELSTKFFKDGDVVWSRKVLLWYMSQ